MPLLEHLSWLGLTWCTGATSTPMASRFTAPLDRLDKDEADLYADLISNAYEKSVRLEQERIRFSLVKAAVEDQPSPLIC